MKKNLFTALCSEDEVDLTPDSFIEDGKEYNVHTENYLDFEIYDKETNKLLGILDVHAFLAYFCFHEKDASNIMKNIDPDDYIFDVLGNGWRRFYEA